MSNAFTNFLSGSGSGIVMKDYQHASRLYVDSTYAKAPKLGFLYFVQLNINKNAVPASGDAWKTNDILDVGLLVKKLDLPKFTIANETVNQYNRKTVVQTKLTYNPISMELHDDNSDITHNLWVNYYKNYYLDGKSGGAPFKDTKFGVTDYGYGRYDNGISVPFLDSIDIYVLHQHRFTQYTLINPKITEWQHDSVSQAEGNKILQNRLNVAYESVIYQEGEIVPGSKPVEWAARYYDTDPSPYTVYKSSNPSTFDRPGKDRVYGTIRPQAPGVLQQLGMLLAKNYINQNGLTRQKAVAYNIAGSVLGHLGSGPGKYASPPSNEQDPGIFTLPGGVGINIFKAFNTSVDGKIRANPAAIIFPPRG